MEKQPDKTNLSPRLVIYCGKSRMVTEKGHKLLDAFLLGTLNHITEEEKKFIWEEYIDTNEFLEIDNLAMDKRYKQRLDKVEVCG